MVLRCGLGGWAGLAPARPPGSAPRQRNTTRSRASASCQRAYILVQESSQARTCRPGMPPKEAMRLHMRWGAQATGWSHNPNPGGDTQTTQSCPPACLGKLPRSLGARTCRTRCHRGPRVDLRTHACATGAREGERDRGARPTGIHVGVHAQEDRVVVAGNSPHTGRRTG
jgi:hypothetical protein